MTEHPAMTLESLPSPTRYTDGSLSREYEEQLGSQPEKAEVVERIARAICVAEGVDPDGLGYATTASTRATLGESYPLWKYRVPAAVAALSALPPQRDDSGLAEQVDLETAAKALAGLKYDDSLGFCSTLEQCGDRERYAERYFRSEFRFARACAEAWRLIYTVSPSRPTEPGQEGA